METQWAKTLQKQRQELTPVFALYEGKMEASFEDTHVKESVSDLISLWNNYLRLWDEMQREQNENKDISARLQTYFEQITCKLSELGEVLFTLLDELELVQFMQKYNDFEKVQEKICISACSIMALNRKALTSDLLVSLGQVEYTLYKCLTEGQKIAGLKGIHEQGWIDPKQYGILKYLYRYCKYSLKDYLHMYKLVTVTIHQQKNVIFNMETVQQMYSSFVRETISHFMPGNLMDTHYNIYNELVIEEKIQHHEFSISQRRTGIDMIIEYLKRIIHEVDIINWSVGKEAKNIINMEKSVHGKSDLSMKKLFSLFEGACTKLKEYEAMLFKYSKLTVASKKSSSFPNRLVQIKALDFNYLVIEGHLKELKNDVHLLYTASKEIYSRRNHIYSKTSSDDP
ncbi:hypothetical protein NEAUS06_2121 [Nematocida ausubeli]|nr:hypothetical protein NEAUS06_2110 [Nematocida ausubeli]KAI5137156.1 hypothetical protein NEAUS06_2121 [Nematocida ausubeli]